MRILFLQKRVLLPADSGGKIRTLGVLRHLARRHEVTYLCNLQEGEEPHAEEMRALGLRVETVPWKESRRWSLRFVIDLALNLASRYPYNVDKDHDPGLRRRAAELLREEPFDLVICDFVQMARNVLGLATPPRILFQHNVEAEIFERHSRRDRMLLRAMYLRHQSRRMERFEAAAGSSFDAVIAVSERDRKTFAERYGWRHVAVIDTGVDTEYFQPAGEAGRSDRVAFVGSLDWWPNQDGLRHFVERIWPTVQRRCPSARFRAIGRHPSAAVRKLARASGVEVVGTVPDVRPYLAEAAVVVVPLYVGGGTRLKIFEAMAMEKAVVSTPLGAEGLPVSDRVDIRIAADDAAFADAVAELLTEETTRRAMAEAARRLVAGRYCQITVARQFEEICTRVAAASSGRSAWRGG